MRKIVKDSWLSTEYGSLPGPGGTAGHVVQAPWDPVVYDLPEGNWLVQWQVVGQNQGVQQYDLAIESKVNPPFESESSLHWQQYASATVGTSFVVGPARFWLKQSSLNYMLGLVDPQIAKFRFSAVDILDAGNAVLTKERAIGLLPVVEVGAPGILFPYLPEGRNAWQSDRFQLIGGRWSGGVPGDILKIYRYCYANPIAAPVAYNLVGSCVVDTLVFNLEQKDYNPSHWVWGLAEMTGGGKVFDLCMCWEKA